MLTLPVELVTFIVIFEPLFSKAVWQHALLLMVGAILATGKRTVTSALRVMGKSHEQHFQNYHRVLNRARWSALAAARLLLRLLIATFAPTGPLAFGIDDTIERRRGEKISAKGVYRDPVRSSRSHFVKTTGLRWLSVMLLVDLAWAERVWALPFLTVLCPSERHHQEQGKRHKKLTDWARQVIIFLHRLLPDRELVFTADSTYAAITLLNKVSQINQVSLITRLRLDAALYEQTPERKKGQRGRQRVKGARLPALKDMLNNPATKWRRLKIANWYGSQEREIETCTGTALWYHPGKAPALIRWVLIRDPTGEFEAQAFLSTKVEHSEKEIVEHFIKRWRMEVTYEEARAHLGVETQRQWNDLAIGRTTPVLFGMYSIVTLVANELMKTDRKRVRTAAWYEKERPTFSDAIGLVRRRIWSHSHFSTSGEEDDIIKIPRSLFERLTEAVCYAA